VLTDLSLFIGGTEWVIILFLAMILVLGAKRLPQFSRTLGKVIGEYQRARSTIEGEITKVGKTMNTPITKMDTIMNMPTTKSEGAASTPDGGTVVTEREKFEAIARALEIEPSGKSTDELKQLISSKINQ